MKFNFKPTPKVKPTPRVKLLTVLLDTLFPLNLTCASCGISQNLDPPYLCPTCALYLEAPKIPIPQSPSLHSSPHSSPFDRMVLGYTLNPLTRALIHRHKYGHERHMAHTLAHLIAQRLIQEGLAPGSFDAVTSIPSGKKRQAQRGCDHCKDIALEVATHYQVPYIKTLKRVRHEHAQADLNRQARERNMEGAFEVIPGALASGPALTSPTPPMPTIPTAPLRLLLIDDVLTTGATLDHAGNLLKSHNPTMTLYAATAFYTPQKPSQI